MIPTAQSRKNHVKAFPHIIDTYKQTNKIPTCMHAVDLEALRSQSCNEQRQVCGHVTTKLTDQRSTLTLTLSADVSCERSQHCVDPSLIMKQLHA